jgi:PIN domain
LITVIVDTTATFDDVMMKSTPWMQLLTLCHDSRIRLVVPDVVLRETARHWEAEAAEAVRIANGKIGGIKNSRERLAALGIDGSNLVDSTPVTAEPDKAHFEQQMRDRLVPLGVEIVPIPDDVTIETVLERDLARIKPFNNAGKGFRDTLVWETASQVVMESDAGDKIFLVTGNSTDYCDVTGALAPELLAEVRVAEGEVIRIADLEEFLTHDELRPLVASLAKTDEDLAKFLALATVPDDPGIRPLPVGQVVKSAVIHALEQLAGDDVETDNVATSGHDFTDLDIPSEIEGLSIDTVAPDESTLTWQTYETYQDTTLLIQAEIQAEISLLGFVYKSDAIHLEESNQAHILDWDWNEHMAYVSTTTAARLTFQVRLEQGMDFVDECDFEGAQPILDYDDTHPWRSNR